MYSAGMNTVQEILREMAQIGRTRSLASQPKLVSKQDDAPVPEGNGRRTRMDELGRDRSGFGPGGDKSGRLAT